MAQGEASAFIGWVECRFRDDQGGLFTENGIVVVRAHGQGRVAIHAYVLDHGDIWKRADSYINFVETVA